MHICNFVMQLHADAVIHALHPIVATCCDLLLYTVALATVLRLSSVGRLYGMYCG